MGKLNFLEKDLEDIIFETDNNILKNRGLSIRGYKFRQVNMGLYGVADIININKSYFDTNGLETLPFLKINIIELKKDAVDINTFFQSIKYARYLQLYFEKRDIDIRIEFTLIGKYIDTKNEFCYLSSVFDNVKFYTYKYQHDGIYFHYRCGYQISDYKIPKPSYKNYVFNKFIDEFNMPF